MYAGVLPLKVPCLPLHMHFKNNLFEFGMEKGPIQAAADFTWEQVIKSILSLSVI